VNATAPAPVRNEEFAHALGDALRRPALLRVPAVVLHHAAGAFADELMLGGQRVIPDKALLSGFTFRHDTLRGALDAILGNGPMRAMPPVRVRSAPAEQPVDQPAVEPAARLLRSLRAR
jgi:hypothetical protein